mgnify:CR=1 FL=1
MHVYIKLEKVTPFVKTPHVTPKKGDGLSRSRIYFDYYLKWGRKIKKIKNACMCARFVCLATIFPPVFPRVFRHRFIRGKEINYFVVVVIPKRNVFTPFNHV